VDTKVPSSLLINTASFRTPGYFGENVTLTEQVAKLASHVPAPAWKSVPCARVKPGAEDNPLRAIVNVRVTAELPLTFALPKSKDASVDCAVTEIAQVLSTIRRVNALVDKGRFASFLAALLCIESDQSSNEILRFVISQD
jgi:hypothetical protein